MKVLFTLLADRYERDSVLMTSNLPFSKWEGIFKDPMTTAAAIDRLVRHAVIELNIPSYRVDAVKRNQQIQPGQHEEPSSRGAVGCGNALKRRGSSIAEIKNDQPKSAIVQNQVGRFQGEIQPVTALNPEEFAEISTRFAGRGRIEGVAAIDKGRYFSVDCCRCE